MGAPDPSPAATIPAGEAVRRVVDEPAFRIESVMIERDQLVVTKLALIIAVDNPNDFPIELISLSYEFYGEGNLWTEGRMEDAEDAPATAVPANAVPANAVPANAVPAYGSLERRLTFTMNFASMDRRLFDLVAKLKLVRYRFKGEARISTGLESLPDFTTSFDQEGSCAVVR